MVSAKSFISALVRISFVSLTDVSSPALSFRKTECLHGNQSVFMLPSWFEIPRFSKCWSLLTGCYSFVLRMILVGLWAVSKYKLFVFKYPRTAPDCELVRNRENLTSQIPRPFSFMPLVSAFTDYLKQRKSLTYCQIYTI